ncbi:MAG: hypothetical protein AAGH46_05825, partial [Bacteroidota bacterium]
VKDPNHSIDSVEIYKLFMVKGELVDTKYFFSCKAISKSGRRLQVNKVTHPHQSKVALVPIDPLPPNLHFEVILYHKFKGMQFQQMLEVINQFNTNDSSGKKAITNLSDKIETKLSNGDSRTAIGRFWLVEGTYNTQISIFFNQLKLTLNNVIGASYGLGVVSKLSTTNLASAQLVYTKLDKSFTLFAEYDRVINDINLRDKFFKGFISTSDFEEAKDYELVKRSNKLNNSIKTTKKIIDALYRIRIQDPASITLYDDMIAEANGFKTKLINNRKTLLNGIEAISSKLDNEKNMRYTTWLDGTNTTRSLETLGSYLIIPVIGLSHIWTSESDINFVKPFVGVSFHLRQVNKKIPMRDLKNSFLHRLSLMLGLTVTQIDDDQKEFFDFNDKFSIMAGINYKITHAFGLSYGGVLMKRADPNPTIVDRQSVVSQYFALTLDVDFAKPLKSLTGKIGL